MEITQAKHVKVIGQIPMIISSKWSNLTQVFWCATGFCDGPILKSWQIEISQNYFVVVVFCVVHEVFQLCDIGGAQIISHISNKIEHEAHMNKNTRYKHWMWKSDCLNCEIYTAPDWCFRGQHIFSFYFNVKKKKLKIGLFILPLCAVTVYAF